MNSNHQVKGKLGTNWCLLFVINLIPGVLYGEAPSTPMSDLTLLGDQLNFLGN